MNSLIKLTLLLVLVLAVTSASLKDLYQEDCMMDHCSNEVNVCTKDPQCMQVGQECSDKCGNNAACMTLCVAGKGNKPCIDVINCAITWKCTWTRPMLSQ